MIGTVQKVSVVGLSSGTFTLAGCSALHWGCSAGQMQAALSVVFGVGNVIVCSNFGTVANDRPVAAATGYYAVMFVGTLWGTDVPDMAIVNSTNGQISIIYKPVVDRIIAFFNRTVDIYKPSTLNNRLSLAPGVPSPEAPDSAEIQIAAYTGVPCGYEPTPNFSDTKGKQRQKLVDIMTADRLVFLADQDILDGYMVVDRTPGSVLQDQPWIVQGNPFVNESTPGNPTETQYVYGVLGAPDEVPGN